MNTNLANRLRVLRHKSGLSQQNIADELGLTVAAYSNLERGVTQLTVSRLTDISRILNVSMGEFFMNDLIISEPNEAYNNPRKQLLYMLDQMHFFKLQIEKIQREVFYLKNKID